MKKKVTASWTCDYEDASIIKWNVYSSISKDVKGDLVATAAPGDRSASWEVEDAAGIGFVRVLPISREGVESAWNSEDVQIADLRVDTLSDTVSLPSSVSVASVESSQTSRVVVNAPTTDDKIAKIQVVEGTDASKGKVVAEVPVQTAGPLGEDGSLQVSASFPSETAPDTSKSYTIRAITEGGRPSPTSTTVSVRSAPMSDFHEVTLASIAGATHTGFPASASGDGHEYDATDGLRTRESPDYETLDNTWGYFGDLTGRWSSQKAWTKYVGSATVESDELDVGLICTFKLSIRDAIQRKTATGFLATIAFDALMVPFDSIRDDRVLGLADGPAWISREFWTDGTPRQGVRYCRWEYVIADTASVPHADSDYKPYVPGQFVRGRYLRVRVILSEPAGMHQLICPAATVIAQIPKSNTVGTGTPESAVSAPPGAVFTRTDGPPYVYQKITGVGNTGWQATNAGSGPLVYADGTVPGGNTVQNTTTPTNFASTYTIPANRLKVGSVIRIRAFGVHGTNTPPATLALAAILGGVTILGTGAITLNAGLTNNQWFAFADVIVTFIGGTGVVEAQGQMSLETGATTALLVPMKNTASVGSIDMTTNALLALQVTWGSAAVTNTITLRTMTVEILDV